MTPPATTAFDLPDHLSPKADPSLIGDDEQHFAAIARSLEESITDVSTRLEATRKAPGGGGQAAMDRDMEIHRLSARLRTLSRFGLDLCLGHMVTADRSEPIYIGRLGLTDHTGRRLLIDWRSPAAEPFFGATHADPMGLISRRRYRWARGLVTDYWDEVFSTEGLTAGTHPALDDQSAFIATLSGHRSDRMQDVLGTIQADQDAIIRAGSDDALIVDGGPGTGKTVVALHRTAYLLYSDPRLGHNRGGVLFVGPHQPYLAYVSDVLPSLGEEGVQTCTLADLVPEGRGTQVESDPQVARLKASVEMVRAIEPAVGMYEEPPTSGMTVETPWADVWLSPADWREAFESVEHGTAHNEARDQVWEVLLAILTDKLKDALDDEDPASWHDEDSDEFDAYSRSTSPSTVPALRRSLTQNSELVRTFGRAWPLLEPAELVADLWSVPAYLRMCAPWLAPEEVAMLQRADSHLWTTSDLPLLDAARLRLGDPEASRRRRRQQAALAAERSRMSDVVEDLIATDDSDLGVMSMLRGQDMRAALADEQAVSRTAPEQFTGPFAHIVVDEAQELTDAQWQMLLARCPSRSFTVVGDRAQARHGFTESWQDRLRRVGMERISQASLSINYRTPEEVMTEAEPVIRAALPDANVPTSVRRSGVPTRYGSTLDLEPIVRSWLAEHADGTVCVIGDGSFPESSRVRSLTPALVKGLEFDLVVLVDPENLGGGIEGAVDRYVAMTRATQELVIVSSAG